MMPAATLIARLIGPLFAALGLGMLLNATFYAAAVGEGAHSPVLIAISGMATLVAGLAILNAYHAWTADWRVLVTVIGWLFIIAGLIRLIVPKLAETARAGGLFRPGRLDGRRRCRARHRRYSQL